MDGSTAAGSCGNQTNNWQACAVLECPQSCGANPNTCLSYAATSSCAGNTESVACSNEWNTASTGVPQCATFSTLSTLWCGP
jgi:hypothetical protein